jgi:hypothetical protein
MRGAPSVYRQDTPALIVIWMGRQVGRDHQSECTPERSGLGLLSERE